MQILLKCFVVGYSNGNGRFTGRLFSNDGSLIMLFHFFLLLIYSVFHETFVKKLMKKLTFFSSNFKNPFQDVEYYRKLRCFTLWSWNAAALWSSKVEKFVHFWGCLFHQYQQRWCENTCSEFRCNVIIGALKALCRL